MRKWLCFLCLLGMIFVSPAILLAANYEAIGILLNFPQGELDGVTRIDVAVSPHPFGVEAIDPYPPAYYDPDSTYLATIIPGYEGQDSQGALGENWIRLPYSSGVQSYACEPYQPLYSTSPDQPGTPLIVDGYVFENFPVISNIDLVGYTGSVQKTLSLVESNYPIEVAVGPFTTTVDVNIWQLLLEPDDTPPVIYLNNMAEDDLVEWTEGVPYTDTGVFAEDNVDGTISYGDLVIRVNGSIGDPSVVLLNPVLDDSHEIVYTATDAAGNVSEGRTRTVQVVADRPPVIYLNGVAADDQVNVYVGSTYTDTGVTAVDDVEGDISGRIVKTVRADNEIIEFEEIDTGQSGVDYIITYQVTDDLDQPAIERTRTVRVIDRPADSGGGGGGGCFISIVQP